MGTTKKLFSVISEDQMDHLQGLWDNGHIKHTGENSDMLKMALGLNFNCDKPPYPYSGLNLRLWAKEGHVLIVKTPHFYIDHNQIPTPSNLLNLVGTLPRIVFCLKPAVFALKQVAEAQDVDMYQDVHAEELTFLFRMNDGKVPKPY